MARPHRRPMSKWPDCYELTCSKEMDFWALLVYIRLSQLALTLTRGSTQNLTFYRRKILMSKFNPCTLRKQIFIIAVDL